MPPHDSALILSNRHRHCPRARIHKIAAGAPVPAQPVAALTAGPVRIRRARHCEDGCPLAPILPIPAAVTAHPTAISIAMTQTRCRPRPQQWSTRTRSGAVGNSRHAAALRSLHWRAVITALSSRRSSLSRSTLAGRCCCGPGLCSSSSSPLLPRARRCGHRRGARRPDRSPSSWRLPSGRGCGPRRTIVPWSTCRSTGIPRHHAG
jgi:hypothetical protein